MNTPNSTTAEPSLGFDEPATGLDGADIDLTGRDAETAEEILDALTVEPEPETVVEAEVVIETEQGAEIEIDLASPDDSEHELSDENHPTLATEVTAVEIETRSVDQPEASVKPKAKIKNESEATIGPKAKTKAKQTAKVKVKANANGETKPGIDPAPGAETNDETKPNVNPEPESETKDDEELTSATGSRNESTSSVRSDVKVKTKAEDESKPAAKSRTRTKPKSEPVVEAKARTKAKDNSEPVVDIHPTTQSSDRPGPDLDSQPTTEIKAKNRDKPDIAADPEIETKDEDEPEAGPDTGIEDETEATADPDTDNEIEATTNPEIEDEGETEASANPEIEDEDEIEATADPEIEDEGETEASTNDEIEAKDGDDTELNADTEIENEAEAEFAPNVVTDETKAGARAKPKAKVKDETNAGASAKPEPKTEDKPEPTATGGTRAEAGVEASAKPEVQTDGAAGLLTVADLGEDLLRAIRLDRSQARLRLPTPMVGETLRIANNLTFPTMTLSRIENLDEVTADLLVSNRILSEDGFDPVAEDLLRVINKASLMITIDLHFGSDSSHRTIWATPREAVVSNEVDPNLVEFKPTDVNFLPMSIHQMMLVKTPRYVGASPISIATEAAAKAEKQRDNGYHEQARLTLTEAGLSEEQATIVLSFDAKKVRRWRIVSAWSTENGRQSRELRGIDTGAKGTWLVAMTGNHSSQRGQITFSPQGHGDVMRSLRAVLPKTWSGIALRPPSL